MKERWDSCPQLHCSTSRYRLFHLCQPAFWKEILRNHATNLQIFQPTLKISTQTTGVAQDYFQQTQSEDKLQVTNGGQQGSALRVGFRIFVCRQREQGFYNTFHLPVYGFYGFPPAWPSRGTQWLQRQFQILAGDPFFPDQNGRIFARQVTDGEWWTSWICKKIGVEQKWREKIGWREWKPQYSTKKKLFHRKRWAVTLRNVPCSKFLVL